MSETSKKPVTEPQRQLFGTLLASQPKHDMRGAAKLTVSSIILHGVIIAGLAWATMTVGQNVVAEEKITFIEIPPEEEPPPPPPPPPGPLRMDAPPPDIADVAKGFQTLDVPTIVPPDIPPPVYGAVIREADFSGRGAEGGKADGRVGGPPVSDITVAPTFTPMTVRPELINRDEIARALVRDYPPLLRDAGIGGTTLLWFLIDETGKVVRTQVKTGSGYEALDEAAARVATIMRFSPAKNRDQIVTVWIEIPIQFQAR